MSIDDYSADGKLAKQLASGLNKLNIESSGKQQQQLLVLLETLYKWNKAYNLTAINQAKEGLKLHILDSLTLFDRFKSISTSKTSPKTILDVGTGAGFPGLPLAVLFPDLKFTLLDSNSKKIRFIRQTVHQLGLKNVEPLHARVESLQNRKFDVITSRAFASLKDMLNLTVSLLDKNGVWLAMKGEFLEQDKIDLPAFSESKSVTQVVIPGVNAERCIVELRLQSEDK